MTNAQALKLVKVLENIFEPTEDAARLDIQKAEDAGIHNQLSILIQDVQGDYNYVCEAMYFTLDPLKWELEEREGDAEFDAHDVTEQAVYENQGLTEPDVSNYKRKQWLGSDRGHVHWLEETIDEFGWDGVGKSLDQAIGWAQYRMKERAAAELIEALPALYSNVNQELL